VSWSFSVSRWCAIQFEPAAESCIPQGSAGDASQIASQQNIRKGFEISEVVLAWPGLPAALRAAVLVIVRMHRGDVPAIRPEGADYAQAEQPIVDKRNATLSNNFSRGKSAAAKTKPTKKGKK
jgi:hypothetical protein